MESEKLSQFVVDALDELKAVNTVSIDVSALTDVMDHIIISSGTSSRHVKSLANNVVVEYKKTGMMPLGVEGEKDGEWVLVDLGDIIVHVMQPQVRDYYNIEKLWDIDASTIEEMRAD